MFDENELSTDHEGARERFYQYPDSLPVLRPLTLSSVEDHIGVLKKDVTMDGIDYVIDFFYDNCIDPTHVILTTTFNAHWSNDDLDYFFLFAGHLKLEPQQILFVAFDFDIKFMM